MVQSIPHAMFLLAMVAGVSAVAQDAVTVATPRGGRSTLAGQIEDYDGQSLLLVKPGGGKQIIPAETILDIQTSPAEFESRAEAARVESQYDQALVFYQQALAAENRRWRRHRIVFEMVWCYRGLGQTTRAGETFLLLMRDRPSDADFACIPLAWSPSQPTPELERAARQWIARADLPAAELLGASHMLSTDPGEALTHLKRLMVDADGVVAQLACAQAWRAEVAVATDEAIAAWRDAVRRMPEPLRAGPHYVMGQALARRGRWDEAALAMLEVPILDARQRDLAAQALLDAGQALEKADQPTGAAAIYRELLKDHPDAPATTEARARLEELPRKSPNSKST